MYFNRYQQLQVGSVWGWGHIPPSVVSEDFNPHHHPKKFHENFRTVALVHLTTLTAIKSLVLMMVESIQEGW